MAYVLQLSCNRTSNQTVLHVQFRAVIIFVEFVNIFAYFMKTNNNSTNGSYLSSKNFHWMSDHLFLNMVVSLTT